MGQDAFFWPVKSEQCRTNGSVTQPIFLDILPFNLDFALCSFKFNIFSLSSGLTILNEIIPSQ